MKTDIKLGALIAGGTVAQRDAVHIAIAPVTSDERMYPGAHVSLVAGTPNKVQPLRGAYREAAIGVVDPFLTEPVERGTPFWLCLYPQTVTSLRHEWTHPAFLANAVPLRNASEQWLREKADRVGVPYQAMLEVSTRKDYPCGFGVEIDGEREIEPEFWEHLKNVTGVDVPDKNRPAYFRCAC